jgi:hypothetical protein
MVLVTAAERRQGLASWLLRCCVDNLLARELVPVLDATPAGRPVYIVGFQDHWTLQLFAERLRYPIGLDSQFRQDDLRRIVARQARDVATEMAARAAKV